MICDIYDNVLEEHVAQLIDMEMKEISWKYDYRSHKDGVNKHWHTLCGHEELFEEYSFLSPIWETAKQKYEEVYIKTGKIFEWPDVLSKSSWKYKLT